MLKQNKSRGFYGGYQKNSNLTKRYPKNNKQQIKKKKKKKKKNKKGNKGKNHQGNNKKGNKNHNNSNKHNLVHLKGQKDLKLQPLPAMHLNTTPTISRSLQIW